MIATPGGHPPLRPEIRWLAGCLIAAVAMLGVLLLLLVLALALQPPPWVQITAGILLVLGSVSVAWLIASALGRSGGADQRGPERPAGDA